MNLLSIVTADKWVGRYVNNNGNFHSNPSIYYDDETIYFAIKRSGMPIEKNNK